MSEESQTGKANQASSLPPKQRLFVAIYLQVFNATEAARQAGYKHPNMAGPRLILKDSIRAAIKEHVDRVAMSADEVLVKLSEQARGDLGSFFKLVEEWTFYPLPTYEIIDAREVIDESDPDHPVKRVSYWVRHVVIDLDKVMDPRYSHLLHRFSDSPKDGIGIEIYNKQTALRDLAKIHGMSAADRSQISWRAEVIALLKAGRITPDVILNELGRDLATELFVLAGVKVQDSAG